MGVISRGTRIGITMTSSKIRPSIRGIIPMRITAINSDFDTYIHTSQSLHQQIFTHLICYNFTHDFHIISSIP